MTAKLHPHEIIERTRRVMVAAFGEPKALRTVGREMQLSHSRIRQIERCALLKIGRRLRGEFTTS